MEFKSWRSYSNFEHSVKRLARYIRTTETDAFLDALLSAASARSETIRTGSFLWRARLEHEFYDAPILGENEEIIDYADTPCPVRPEKMKPLRQSAREGRVNPKGVPCLYLATNIETAMAEMRPWNGQFISVGQFELARDARVVNVTVDDPCPSRIFVNCEPSADVREKYVLADIDRAFAQPVDRSDSSADYVPTQIIGELFKAHGFDGIAYRSSVGPGHNVALFEIDLAEQANSGLWRAVMTAGPEEATITLRFEEVDPIQRLPRQPPASF